MAMAKRNSMPRRSVRIFDELPTMPCGTLLGPEMRFRMNPTFLYFATTSPASPTGDQFHSTRQRRLAAVQEPPVDHHMPREPAAAQEPVGEGLLEALHD
jgi:hypothetical protein